MYCRKCGFEIPDDSAFCTKCGTPVDGAAGTQPAAVYISELPKEKSAAVTPPKKKKTGLVIACAAVGLALVLAGLYFFVLKGAGGGKDKVPAAEEAPVSILEDKEKLSEVTASVLKIECCDITGEVYATGSGFVAFDSDLIVTNYHVIEDHPYAITALAEDGTSFPIAEIVAYNEEMDIAILKASEGTNLAPLSFADKATEKTDKVVAIGSPLGLMNIVSEGIVSGFTQVGNESVIQFTASISHGSSGGVLLNEAGEVVGVTFASYSEGQNLNMAIPIQYVEALYSQSSQAGIVTIKQFYDAAEHVLPFAYIFEHKDEYMGKYVIVQAYVSSSWYFFGEESGSAFSKEHALVYLVEDAHDVSGWVSQNNSDIMEKLEEAVKERNKADSNKAITLWIKRKEVNDKLLPGSYIAVRGKLVTMQEKFPTLAQGNYSLTLDADTITY